MNSLRNVFAVLAAAFFLTSIGFAADPSGEWKWTMGGRGGGGGGGQGTPPELTLTLALKDGQLTGKLAGGRGEPVAIADASFKDDTVAFTVSRQMPNGNAWTSKYTGKISGDTITGTIEGPGRGGEVMKREWVAKRAK
jgi:hypothetical protein